MNEENKIVETQEEVDLMDNEELRSDPGAIKKVPELRNDGWISNSFSCYFR